MTVIGCKLDAGGAINRPRNSHERLRSRLGKSVIQTRELLSSHLTWDVIAYRIDESAPDGSTGRDWRLAKRKGPVKRRASERAITCINSISTDR